MKLRSQYQSLKKAKAHAHDMLPTEPQSLVAKYLTGKERPSKEQVVASGHVSVNQPYLQVKKEGHKISPVLVRESVLHESATVGQWKCCVTANVTLDQQSV